MADKKFDNLARKPEFHDNDPFAELTRLIGLDSSSASSAPEDDFVIDLERELLGGFEDAVIPDPVNDTHASVAPAILPAAGNAKDAFAGQPVDQATEAVSIDAPGGAWLDAAEFHTSPASAGEAEEQVETDVAAAFDAAFLDMDFGGEADASVADAGFEPPGEGPQGLRQVAVEHDGFEEPQSDFDARSDEAAFPQDEPVSPGSGEFVETEGFVDSGYPDDPAMSGTSTASWIHQLRGRIEREVNRVADDPALPESAPAGSVAAGLYSYSPSAMPEQPVDQRSGETPSPGELPVVAESDLAQALELDLGGAFEAALTDESEALDGPEAAGDAGDWNAEAEQSPPVEQGSTTAPAEQPRLEPAGDDPFAELAAMAAAPAVTFTRANLRPLPPIGSPTTPDAQAALVEERRMETGDEPLFDGRAFDDAVFSETGDEAGAARDAWPDVAATQQPHQEAAIGWDDAFAQEFAREAVSPDSQAAPEIETTEIVDASFAIADDLDIPDVPIEEPAPAVAFDDLEHEIGAMFGDLPVEEPDSAAPAPATAPNPEDRLSEVVERTFAAASPVTEIANDRFQSAAVWETSVGAGAAAGAANGPTEPSPAPLSRQPAVSRLPAHEAAESGGDFLGDEFDFDNAFAEEEIARTEERSSRRSHRRSLMLLAGVACVALAGGAVAWTFGGGESSAPVLVRADDGPVKVRPENPGGATVPNQDSQAYRRVSSGPTEAAPAQERLVSTTEEPVDVATRVVAVAPPAAEEDPVSVPSGMVEGEEADVSAAGVAGDEIAAIAADGLDDDAAAPSPAKNEDRVPAMPEPAAQATAEDGALVAPRRVRTMVVRPDGTMVPREEPVAQAAAPQEPALAISEPTPAMPPLVAAEKTPAAAERVESAAQAARPAVASESVRPEPVAAAAPAPAATAVEAAARQQAPATPPAEERAQTRSVSTPATVPVAPSRPADQPVDIVGEVRRTQVAAAPSVPQPDQPAAAGTWSVQIASQPSAESAQATYVDLARRYGDVIGGRGVNIVKAEIAGRGTFYRVRIPAASRADANTICARYKTAGGNCFVSQ